ncbi:MAG TPA: VWA domain-containing protein [Planctomycetota bacterium]|nr:VWA domain-containing protein [Planctomycetota bacterium]
MRRAAIITVRSLIVLTLLAAALDLKLPGRSRDRVRIHLIDRSASVLVPGPVESLLPRDADEIVARDVATKPGGDVITWASFGRAPAFESPSVDPSATDLAAALTAALGRNPTEIVLYSDGRGDPGNALFLCRDRKVPVYVFPLGPTTVKDARITRIETPGNARPNAPVSVAVIVESTFDVKARLTVGSEGRDVSLTANVPTRAAFTLPGTGTFNVDLDVQDACPENNHAKGEVLPRSDKRKILFLSAKAPALPDFDVDVAQKIQSLAPYEAVVLDNVDLTAAELQTLATWVKSGGGLLLTGGSRSYALGSWKGTPLEELSPLKIKPDLKVAAVFGIDSSGSMTQEFSPAVEAIGDALTVFDADDDLVAMTFSDDAKVMEIAKLRKERPTGGTSLVKGIERARRHLETRQAGRKVIVLMTDGETKETPEEIQAAVSNLKDIGLIVITTKKNVPGAENIPMTDWKALRGKLEEVVKGIQELKRINPGQVEFSRHPASAGVAAFSPAWINRTTAKAGAQVVATVGRTPAQDPVLAFGSAEKGRVGALTVEAASTPAALLRQAVEVVAGDGAAGLILSIDPPFVRARGTFKDSTFETTLTPVLMKQVASDAWEGRLPDGLSGPVVVAKGRARAAATIPCPPEFERLGVDRAALERIAGETGGRVLRSPNELPALPRAENPSSRSGRTLFLVAALALVFVELAVSTFWKV